MNLTQTDLEILRHTLGLNTLEPKSKPYRNYYAADPKDPKIARLCDLGLMEYRSKCGDMFYFHCTAMGKKAALESMPKWTKGKRIYRAFLSVRDCCADLTFREFITHPHFAKTREEA